MTRALAISGAVLYAAWVAYPQVLGLTDRLVVETWSLRGAGAAAWTTLPMVAWSFLVLRVFALALILNGKPLGTWLFIGWLAVNVVSTPFSGLAVQSPLEATLGFALSIVDGATAFALVSERRAHGDRETTA
jgi:hypothetical protein